MIQGEFGKQKLAREREHDAQMRRLAKAVLIPVVVAVVLLTVAFTLGVRV